MGDIRKSLVRFLLSGGYHRDWKRFGWYNSTSQTFIPDSEIAKVTTASEAAEVAVHGRVASCNERN